MAVRKSTKKQSVREKQARKKPASSSRVKTVVGKATKPFKKAHKAGQKEYHLPMPNNKLGRLLSKRGRLVPKFFREAWAEIKLVTWPNRRETYRLTIAVFIFSIVFGALVASLDIALDKLFKEVIINK